MKWVPTISDKRSMFGWFVNLYVELKRQLGMLLNLYQAGLLDVL
jgi:hypothetical protein